LNSGVLDTLADWLAQASSPFGTDTYSTYNDLEYVIRGITALAVARPDQINILPNASSGIPQLSINIPAHQNVFPEQQFDLERVRHALTTFMERFQDKLQTPDVAQALAASGGGIEQAIALRRQSRTTAGWPDTTLQSILKQYWNAQQQSAEASPADNIPPLALPPGLSDATAAARAAVAGNRGETQPRDDSAGIAAGAQVVQNELGTPVETQEGLPTPSITVRFGATVRRAANVVRHPRGSRRS